ncbi:MAG: DoxX family protein [Gammaproteobacteria bacterium]|nr:DoxX family protein [Gammaproteobacteria bacterium]
MAFIAFIESLIALLKRIPHDLVALVCRFGVGMVFWLSGRTKVEGWNIFDLKASQKFLFTEVHPVPGVPWEVAAQLAAIGEHLFPLLLFVGLATRFAAVALLAMTVVIQIALPTGFAAHLLWAGVLLYLMAQGPGRVSADWLLVRRAPWQQ